MSIPIEHMKAIVEEYIFRLKGARVNIVLNMENENEECARLQYAFLVATNQI